MLDCLISIIAEIKPTVTILEVYNRCIFGLSRQTFVGRYFLPPASTEPVSTFCAYRSKQG